jgi:hypothetical protein
MFARLFLLIFAVLGLARSDGPAPNTPSQPAVAPEFAAAAPDADLQLPEINGNGRFGKYSMRGDNLAPEAVGESLKGARAFNGRRLRLKIELRIRYPSPWKPGDSIAPGDLALSQ